MYIGLRQLTVVGFSSTTFE